MPSHFVPLGVEWLESKIDLFSLPSPTMFGGIESKRLRACRRNAWRLGGRVRLGVEPECKKGERLCNRWTHKTTLKEYDLDM